MFKFLLMSFVSFSILLAKNGYAEDGKGPRTPIGPSIRSESVQLRIAELEQKEFEKFRTRKSLDDAAAHDHPLPQGVPKAFVSLGNTLPAYGIVVEKLHHRLTVFQKSQSGKMEILKTYRAVTGKGFGDKSSRGDLKTPEGVYFATHTLPDEKLPPKYGVFAFVLDFPNVFDRQKRKTGSGIWVHATDKPNRVLTPFDTEGCVAVTNEDIVDLKKYIIPFQTPIVIAKEMETVESYESLSEPREQSLAMVNSWKETWENGDFKSYSDHYSDDFRAQTLTKKTWLESKVSLFERRGTTIEIKLTQPRIVAFEDQLLAVFFQEYISNEKKDFGQKFLYLKWENDRYRIVSEKWYPSKLSEDIFQALK